MMPGRLSSLLLVSLTCLIGLPVPVWAQTGEDSTAPVQVSVVEPDYRVTELAATATADTIDGTFSLVNTSTAPFGDVGYIVQILAPLPELETNTLVSDSGPTYASTVSERTLTVPPGGSVTESFSIPTPDYLPGGDYRVRIQTVNAKGREQAWDTTTITLPERDIPSFAVLAPEAVRVAGDDQAHSPRSGPTAASGSDVVLEYTITNPTTVPITGTPELTVYEFARNRPLIETARGDTLTIEPGASQTTTFTITAASVPEAYAGFLRIVDGAGRPISSEAEFRWVVPGESAEVITAHFTELTTETAVVTGEIIGAADGETTFTGTVQVYLLDGKTQIDMQTQPVTLSTAPQQIRAQFAMPRELAAPGLRVEITGTDGTILDSYTQMVPASFINEGSDTNATLRRLLFLLIGLLFVSGLALLVWAGWRYRTTGSTKAASVAGALLVTGGLISSAVVAHSTAARTGLYVEGDKPKGTHHVQLVVQKPFHNATITDPSRVRVEYQVTGQRHCGNSDDSILEQIEYLAAGGHAGPYQLNFARNSCAASTARTSNVANPSIYTGATVERSGWVLPAGLENYTGIGRTYDSGLRIATLDLSGALDPQGKGTIRILAWATDADQLQCNYVDVVHTSTRDGIEKHLNDFDDEAYPAWIANGRNKLGVDGWSHAYLWLTWQKPKACNDDLDNDSDGAIDEADPGCHVDDDLNKPYDPTDNDENQSPVARMVGLPTTYLGDSVTLDGSDSYDPDGRLEAWEWRMTEQTTGERVTTTGEVTSFTPTRAGEYHVRLIVRDTLGRQGVAREQFYTVENQPPVAQIQAIPTTYLGDVVTLDGSGSSDPEGELEAWEWGVTDEETGTTTTATGETASFTPTRETRYSVQLLVRDARGRQAVAQAAFLAIPRTVEAQITVTGDQVNEPVLLDGSNSSPRENIVSYDWGVTGPDGVIPLDDASAPTASFVPTVTGTYTISLRVVDRWGNEDTATRTHEVTDGGSLSPSPTFQPGPIIETD